MSLTLRTLSLCFCARRFYIFTEDLNIFTKNVSHFFTEDVFMYLRKMSLCIYGRCLYAFTEDVCNYGRCVTIYFRKMFFCIYGRRIYAIMKDVSIYFRKMSLLPAEAMNPALLETSSHIYPTAEQSSSRNY